MDAFSIQVGKDGKEIVSPAVNTAPGNVIEYRVSYQNNQTSDVRDLIVNGPVPPQTAYLAGSAKSQTAHQLQFSVDGGASWQKEPITRKAKGADGKLRDEIVPASEYTHVRWLSKDVLKSRGGQQAFSYRVRVRGAE